jgi:hypothetical protein
VDDYAPLYGPIYTVHGVPAALRFASGEYYDDLTAIDMTMGLPLPGSVEVETLRPAALLYVPDLIARGIDFDSLDGAALTLNGIAWRVNGYRLKPAPTGRLEGEAYLLLEGDAEVMPF